MTTTASTALITGASRGLGLALARSLAAAGWALVIDGRDALDLAAAADALVEAEGVTAIVGGLDLVVLNAGTLGPSPLPPVAHLDLGDLRATLETNRVAQVGLVQAVLPHLRPAAMLIAVTSDAGVEPYEGWAAYGAAKAGFEHVAAILGAERPDLRVLRVDPGDMRTRMHQDAFPGEDISDRPLPEESVPGIRTLIDGPYPTGRYRVADISRAAGVA